jgi:hypothetical protein
MIERVNLYAIHSWDNPDACRRMEQLLRESDPSLVHYSVLPERALEGTAEEVRANITKRISFATAVVVMNTPGLHKGQTASFEMDTAVRMGKRIVLVQPPDNFRQPIPAMLDGHVYRYAGWRSDVVGRAVRGEYPYDSRVFDIAEVADRRALVGILAAGVAATSFLICTKVAGADRTLQRELADAGVDLRWSKTDTASVFGHALVGTLLFAGLTAIFSRDTKTALLAGVAGGAIGATVGVHRVYSAHLLGTSHLRVLAVGPR